MRKGLSIVLLCCYLLSSIGVFAEAHFCGQRLTAISVLVKSHEADCSCKVVKKPTCCSEVSVKAKLETEATVILSLKPTKPECFKTINLFGYSISDITGFGVNAIQLQSRNAVFKETTIGGIIEHSLMRI